jgi:hypothetical protein
MSDLRAAIDKAANPEPVKVPTPEWAPAEHVWLRVLTGAERAALEDKYRKSAQTGNVDSRSELLIRCLCDDQGHRLYGDADANILGAKAATVLDRLFVQAAELNALGGEGVKAAEKNL